MPNLIYSAIFFNEGYLALTDLLLESHKKYETSNTKYLIITSALYKKRVQALFDKHDIDGDIWCINSIYTQFTACCARLHIFSYPEIDKYDKLLYLDCDILITNPMEPLFDIQLEEKLYAMSLPNATINDWGNGKDLFIENNVTIDPEASTFASCILLFKNCERIKLLFTDIITHIQERVPDAYDLKSAFDQDFIIYQCFIQDCYDNVHLTKYARSNGSYDDKEMILNHFSAVYETTCATPYGKLDWMQLYLARTGISKYSKSIIHIGANVGDCIHASEEYQLFDTVSIHHNCVFVEPVPYLFKQLKENYNKKYPGNHFIFINKAVSTKVGEVEMTVASEENDFEKMPFWANMLGSMNANHIANHMVKGVDDLITEKITVPATTINEIVKEAGMTSIDLLQVDAEGYDFEIIMAYDFSVLPKKIIFEYFHMKQGNLSILMQQLVLKGYILTGQTELDIIMELR